MYLCPLPPKKDLVNRDIFFLVRASPVDQRTRNHPGHTAVELSHLGQVNWLRLGSLFPSMHGPLLLPETRFWIKHCASRQKPGACRDGVSGRGLSRCEHLRPVLAKPVQFIQSGRRDGSLLAGCIYVSAAPTSCPSAWIQ